MVLRAVCHLQVVGANLIYCLPLGFNVSVAYRISLIRGSTVHSSRVVTSPTNVKHQSSVACSLTGDRSK